MPGDRHNGGRGRIEIGARRYYMLAPWAKLVVILALTARHDHTIGQATRKVGVPGGPPGILPLCLTDSQRHDA